MGLSLSILVFSGAQLVLGDASLCTISSSEAASEAGRQDSSQDGEPSLGVSPRGQISRRCGGVREAIRGRSLRPGGSTVTVWNSVLGGELVWHVREAAPLCPQR